MTLTERWKSRSSQNSSVRSDDSWPRNHRSYGHARAVGMRITLTEHPGEGWFPEYACQSLSATVERAVATGDGPPPYYLIRFDNVIELQETGFDTPTGFGLSRYSHAMIRSRLRDVDIQVNQSIPVFVCLVREGEVLPITNEATKGLDVRAWASCRVSE
jgi:hypothetical protein